MGIYKLMDLIREKAPDAIRTVQLDIFAGKVVACDASMVSNILFSMKSSSKMSHLIDSLFINLSSQLKDIIKLVV